MSDEHDDGLGMSLVEAMETQRAVRRLLPDPVDDATILRVLELATKAPTGSNLQNWEFVVVRDPDVKHQLARLNRQAWSIYRRLGKRRAKGHEPTLKIIDAVQWQADHFEEVPVVVVACLRGRSPMFGPAGARLELLRLRLPGRAEPAAGGPGRRPGRHPHHPPALVDHPGPPHPRAPGQGDPGRGRPDGLAEGAIRPDHPQTGGRSRPSGPVRESALPVSC